MRLFVAEDDGVSELTQGDQQIIRVTASDLQQARRVRARIRAGADDVAVILDVTISVAGDFRSAQNLLVGALAPAHAQTVHYAGTVEGLAGLIADIASAEVADGVTLIPASPRQDVGAVGRDVLGRLALRDQPRAS